LKTIFGNKPNTILYRALGDWESNADIASDAVAFQKQGIIPVVVLITYPKWTSFANEAAAYNWAYNSVKATVQAAPTVQVYEIGNEWTLQDPIFSQFTGDGSMASDWKSAASFPLYRGAMAGAVAAIRDHSTAQILGGVLGGWTLLGFAPAIQNDLVSYKTPGGTTRNLTWDFTVDHWYNDTSGLTNSNHMGPTDNFNGGMNAYQLLNGALKPIIWTEFGSSNGSKASYDNQAGTEITGIMDNFLAHKDATGSERGVVGGMAYQLYQMPNVQTDYFLYRYTGGSTATIAPQGTAVKNWIAQHSNPSSADTPIIAPPTDSVTEVNFSDISGHWAEAGIKQAVSGGIVKGYTDGTFKPNHTVTRSEFAVMLMNTLKPQGAGAELTFTDTAKIGTWAQKAVAQAVQAGIIKGYADGSFRPDATIIRTEMAAMNANALSLTAQSNTETGFADDKDIPAWAKDAVAAIKKLGIVTGKGINEFAPNANTTRAEAVTVLLKMLAQKSK
jgi:hypothetical protein